MDFQGKKRVVGPFMLTVRENVKELLTLLPNTYIPKTQQDASKHPLSMTPATTPRSSSGINILPS